MLDSTYLHSACSRHLTFVKFAHLLGVIKLYSESYSPLGSYLSPIPAVGFDVGFIVLGFVGFAVGILGDLVGDKDVGLLVGLFVGLLVGEY